LEQETSPCSQSLWLRRLWRWWWWRRRIQRKRRRSMRRRKRRRKKPGKGI
jgi:hypothetical protein